MLVNHKLGLATVLSAGGDPYDEDELELLCSTCSGIEDGGRAQLEGVGTPVADQPGHPARRPTGNSRAGSQNQNP